MVVKYNLYFETNGETQAEFLKRNPNSWIPNWLKPLPQDPNLTLTGIFQAQEIREKLKKPDFVFCSNLFSDIQTALLSFPEKEVIVVPFLKEKNHLGDIFNKENKPFPSISEQLQTRCKNPRDLQRICYYSPHLLDVETCQYSHGSTNKSGNVKKCMLNIIPIILHEDFSPAVNVLQKTTREVKNLVFVLHPGILNQFLKRYTSLDTAVTNGTLIKLNKTPMSFTEIKEYLINRTMFDEIEIMYESTGDQPRNFKTCQQIIEKKQSPPGEEKGKRLGQGVTGKVFVGKKQGQALKVSKTWLDTYLASLDQAQRRAFEQKEALTENMIQDLYTPYKEEETTADESFIKQKKINQQIEKIPDLKQSVLHIQRLGKAGKVLIQERLSWRGWITLEDFLKSHSTNDEQNLKIKLRVFTNLVLVINKLHKHKIVHNDLQEGNILVNQNTCKIKLLDFGISCIYNSEDPNIRCKPENKNMTHFEKLDHFSLAKLFERFFLSNKSNEGQHIIKLLKKIPTKQQKKVLKQLLRIPHVSEILNDYSISDQIF